MNEDFQGQARVARRGWSRPQAVAITIDLLNFLQRTLARQHHEVAANLSGKFHARPAGNRHLRGGVNRKIGGKLSNQPANSNILHNGGIHAGGDQRAKISGGVRQLICKHQRVERHVALDAAAVQEFHQPWQIGFRKILRPHPRIEAFKPEVDGVGPIFHSGAGALPITRRQQLRRRQAVLRRRRAVLR